MGNSVTVPTSSQTNTTSQLEVVGDCSENRLISSYESPLATHQYLEVNNNAELTEHDLKLAIRSLDTLVSQVLRDKANKHQYARDKSKVNESWIHSEPTGLDSNLSNLGQMLNTQIEDYLTMAKQSGIVTAPAYKCAVDSKPSNSTRTDKLNYKNLFPKLDSMNSMFANVINAYTGDPDSVSPFVKRKNSQPFHSATNLFAHPNNNVSRAEPGESCFPLESNSADTIRINLPEILDQQDEVTILRLLIKLLASKVNKLNEEKRRLLQNISSLNDINIEMAAIIEHNMKK